MYLEGLISGTKFPLPSPGGVGELYVVKNGLTDNCASNSTGGKYVSFPILGALPLSATCNYVL